MHKREFIFVKPGAANGKIRPGSFLEPKQLSVKPYDSLDVRRISHDIEVIQFVNPHNCFLLSLIC
jgi:hypothetical protein